MRFLPVPVRLQVFIFNPIRRVYKERNSTDSGEPVHTGLCSIG